MILGSSRCIEMAQFYRHEHQIPGESQHQNTTIENIEMEKGIIQLSSVMLYALNVHRTSHAFGSPKILVLALSWQKAGISGRVSRHTHHTSCCCYASGFGYFIRMHPFPLYFQEVFARYKWLKSTVLLVYVYETRASWLPGRVSETRKIFDKINSSGWINW